LNFDHAAWMKGLDNLGSPKLRESLARSMAVAGGTVLRDEAKRWVPNGEKSNSKTPGLLERSIYLAYSEKRSTPSRPVYSVSWNTSRGPNRAPHGHLIEFGHWQTHASYQGPDGQWRTGAPLPSPKWVAAKPFLRPAQDVAGAQAVQAMIDRGRERLPELLRDLYQPADEEFV